MEPILLSIDMILRAIIGSPQKVQNLIDRARSGQAYFVVPEFALYCALCSVKNDDSTNLTLLSELLKYSGIEPESPVNEGLGETKFLGPDPRRDPTLASSGIGYR